MAVVRELFWKPDLVTEMRATAELDLVKNYGIKGDRYASNSSPRQVLVVNEQDLKTFAISPGELRENIALGGLAVNNFQPGAKLTFPSGAIIRLTFYCEPCSRIAHLVNSLVEINQKRGILAVVMASGVIKKGDRVTVEPSFFPPLSEIPYERFLSLLAKIPPGKVLTYKQILHAIGVDRSYYRVLPLYLKKTITNLPKHRVLNSQGKTTTHIPKQRELLASEGVAVDNSGFVSLEKYGWKEPSIFG